MLLQSIDLNNNFDAKVVVHFLPISYLQRRR